MLRIIEITKKYGFPGERLIGIDTKNMHPKINTNRLSAGMPIVIFIHHYSQPNQSYNSILLPEVIKGNFLNEHYAIISNFQYTYGKSKENMYCFSTIFKPEIDIREIDKNRKKIYLLSITETSELNKKKLITPKYHLN